MFVALVSVIPSLYDRDPKVVSIPTQLTTDFSCSQRPSGFRSWPFINLKIFGGNGNEGVISLPGSRHTAIFLYSNLEGAGGDGEEYR